MHSQQPIRETKPRVRQCNFDANMLRELRETTVFFTRFSLMEWILGSVFAIYVACSVIDSSFCLHCTFST